jgi:hypothetical protein
MIDTDKYEGHTKGGWYVDDAPDVIHPTVIHENQCDAIVAELVAITGEWTEEDYANARLIADAPLLLAEVKRLQKEHDTVRGWFLDIDNYMMEHHYDMWQEIRKEIGLDD